jgi:hypothetical protein
MIKLLKHLLRCEHFMLCREQPGIQFHDQNVGSRWTISVATYGGTMTQKMEKKNKKKQSFIKQDAKTV